jgi:hypothetical protein
MLPVFNNSFLRVRSLSHQQHVRLIVDDGGEALAEKRMVVHAENTDLNFFCHRACSLPDFSPFFIFLYNLDNQLAGRLPGRTSKAMLAGTDNSTSVPATALT